MRVNGRPIARLSCSTSHLEELVIGNLYTEGYISSIGDIASVEISDRNERADVLLRSRTENLALATSETAQLRDVRPVTNCNFAGCKGMRPVEPIIWTPDSIFAMMDVFASDHERHCRTRGTHSAYLWKGGKLRCRSEDIGRRNAFDKAIGAALIEEVELSECALFISGRISTDMVAKAIESRIPILVSKAAATDGSIELARALHLTLVCNARNDSMEVVSDSTEIGFAT